LTEPHSFSCPSCPAALTPVRLAPRLRPCLEPALQPALLDPVLQLSSSACPAALPLAFASGPASDQPCGRPLGPASDSHCLLLPSGAASVRLAPRQRPASNWSLARAFSSTSGLNLQLITVCRFSSCRRALMSLPPRGFRSSWPFGIALSSVS